jgi:hypothetical protein
VLYNVYYSHQLLFILLLLLVYNDGQGSYQYFDPNQKDYEPGFGSIQDSVSNIDSDDSYVPDEDQLSSSDHDSESEIREEAILCENKDDAHDQDDNVSDKELRHLVLTLPPLSHVTRLLMKAALVLVKK